MIDRVKKWTDIKDDGFQSLLLGNGFSINISSKFKYTSILDTYSDRPVGRYRCTRELFDKLSTSNFENVLRAIYHALLVSIDNKKAINTLYDDVKSALIEGIKNVHPLSSEVNKEAIKNELVNYRNVFTTNYDLILYWVIMDGLPSEFIDFFWGGNGNCAFDIKNCEIYGRKRPIYYLHGAVHLKSNTVGGTFKSKIKLDKVDDFYRDIEEDEFPLFITEGHSELKLKRIEENRYLRFCFDRLRKTDDNLLVFGHHLSAEYDSHIVDAIKDSGISKVAISVYSEQSDLKKKEFVVRIDSMFEKSEKNLIYFESNTHPFGVNQS